MVHFVDLLMYTSPHCIMFFEDSHATVATIVLNAIGKVGVQARKEESH
jgi:hypothetical protein